MLLATIGRANGSKTLVCAAASTLCTFLPLPGHMFGSWELAVPTIGPAVALQTTDPARARALSLSCELVTGWISPTVRCENTPWAVRLQHDAARRRQPRCGDGAPPRHHRLGHRSFSTRTGRMQQQQFSSIYSACFYSLFSKVELQYSSVLHT